MPLSEQERDAVEEFCAYVADALAGDDRYGPVSRCDSQDESTLALRFEAGDSCWFEVAVCPFVPQLRVAFLTNNCQRGEEIEQAIQESGDTMGGLVELGFSEAGLDWPNPPVERYREAGEYFCFATPLEIDELGDLYFNDFRGKVLRMLEGYLIAFGPALVEEETGEEEVDLLREDD